jgi:hypothetical protein
VISLVEPHFFFITSNIQALSRMVGPMLDIITGLTPWVTASLILALTFVLAFEFINGFHDTANAVATVI